MSYQFHNVESGPFLSISGKKSESKELTVSLDCISTSSYRTFAKANSYSTSAERNDEPYYDSNYLTDSLRKDYDDSAIPAFCISPADAESFCRSEQVRLLSIDEWLRIAFWYHECSREFLQNLKFNLRNQELVFDKRTKKYFSMSSPDYARFDKDEWGECMVEVSKTDFDTMFCFRVTNADT